MIDISNSEAGILSFNKILKLGELSTYFQYNHNSAENYRYFASTTEVNFKENHNAITNMNRGIGKI